MEKMKIDQEEHIASILNNQRSARNEGKFDLAEKIANEGEEYLNQLPEETCLVYWSRLSYEKAFMLSIKGMPEEAAKYFLLSGEYAHKNGDQTRKAIGDFRYALTLYLAGLIDSNETFEKISEVYQIQNNISEVPLGDEGLLENSKFNTLKRLCELSFGKNKNEYLGVADIILSSDFLVRSVLQPQAMYEILRWQITARKAMINENYIRAISILSGLLDFKITGIKVDDVFIEQKEMFSNGLETTEELSREYRDFGRAIMKSDIENKEKWAAKVWHQGLEIPKGRGNLIFLRDIQNDLGTLT